jgi:hypothetical protein
MPYAPNVTLLIPLPAAPRKMPAVLPNQEGIMPVERNVLA